MKKKKLRTITNEELQLIDKTIGPLARNFAFGYYSFEDMMQEGRIFAMTAISKYDPSKGASLSTFIFNHVKNRFINLVRDKFNRTQPPCLMCKYNTKKRKCKKYFDKTECDKWCKWRDNNTVRRNLINTYQISQSHADSIIDGDIHVAEKLANQEILNFVDRRVPISVRADYRRYIDGAKLSKLKRLKVERIIKKILVGWINAEEI